MITIGAVAADVDVAAGAKALKDKIVALTISVDPAAITQAGNAETNKTAAQTALDAAIAADSSIEATGYTITVTGVTGITDAVEDTTDGEATVAFTVTKTDTPANTANGTVTIKINKTATS